MATLTENANAVKAAQEEIDAAIRAKGATTAGGLNNAAAAIATIQTGGVLPETIQVESSTGYLYVTTDKLTY